VTNLTVLRVGRKNTNTRSHRCLVLRLIVLASSTRDKEIFLKPRPESCNFSGCSEVCVAEITLHFYKPAFRAHWLLKALQGQAQSPVVLSEHGYKRKTEGVSCITSSACIQTVADSSLPACPCRTPALCSKLLLSSEPTPQMSVYGRHGHHGGFCFILFQRKN